MTSDTECYVYITLPRRTDFVTAESATIYTKKEFGSACWARTSDPLINSQLLYQLS